MPEILIYRDEEHSLYGAPFLPFVEQNKHLNFNDFFCTANWRGYQGYWLLKDDILYLAKLESANYSLKDLFETENPVIANWYSGILEFGFGNFHCYDDYWCLGYYDNYVWLNIQNGKVLEKKITNVYNNEKPITFGKYKGKTFEEVLYGKIKDDEDVTIRNFINCIITFITKKDFHFRIQSGYFQIEQKEKDFVKEIKDYKVEYLLTKNYIAFHSILAEELSDLIEKMLLSNFYIFYTFTQHTTKDNAEIAEESFLINPDINYLNWALKNVDSFFISPLYLKNKFRIKRLKSFNIKRLNKTIFEYEPIIEFHDYEFSGIIQKINQEKFEKAYNVKYDEINNILTPNMSDSEMMEYYGFYLDETYIPSNNEGYGEYDSYDRDYYYNSDNWLRDAAGTSDPEVMSDVYWNLD